MKKENEGELIGWGDAGDGAGLLSPKEIYHIYPLYLSHLECNCMIFNCVLMKHVSACFSLPYGI